MLSCAAANRLFFSRLVRYQHRLATAATVPSFHTMNDHMKNGRFKEALDYFEHQQITSSSLLPSSLYTSAIKACTKLGQFDRAKEIHKRIPTSRLNNPFLVGSLINLYMQSSDINAGEQIFDQCSENPTPGIIGSMMKGYITCGKHEKALHIYEQYKTQIKRSDVTYNLLFSACTGLGSGENQYAVQMGRKYLSAYLATNPDVNDTGVIITLCSALHFLFTSCKDVKEAENLLRRIAREKWTTTLVNTLLKGYITCEKYEKALLIYEQNKIHIKSDSITYNLLFSACANLGSENEHAIQIGQKNLVEFLANTSNVNDTSTINTVSSALHFLFTSCNNVQGAEKVLTRIPRSKWTTSLVNVLIKGYNTNSLPDKSIQLFEDMHHSLKPNDITYTLVAKSCAQIGMLHLAEKMFNQILPSGSCADNVQLSNSLVDMFGKCGSMTRAQQVFDQIKNPDSVAYNALINGYALNGHGSEAVQIFHTTPANLRTDITYISVLNACSHSGLLTEARTIYQEMRMEFKSSEKIVTTMVDCLSRASHFDEAERLMAEFEQVHAPYAPMHMALLSGARNQQNATLSQKYFDRMKGLFPNLKNDEMTSASTLLTNTLFSSGRHDEAVNIREEMRKER